MMKLAGLNKESSVIDLGAGRSCVLLLVKFLGAKARGIDLNPEHVAVAKWTLKHTGIGYAAANAKTIELESYSHAYLAWTTWSTRTRHGIVKNLLNMRQGAKIIVLSWQIADINFSEVKRGLALFSWGLAPYFIYERI